MKVSKEGTKVYVAISTERHLEHVVTLGVFKKQWQAMSCCAKDAHLWAGLFFQGLQWVGEETKLAEVMRGHKSYVYRIEEMELQ